MRRFGMSFIRIAFALACLFVLCVQGYADTAQSTQVPAGSTAAIGKTVNSPAPATTTTPQGKILTSALSTDTRKTLEAAMDSGAH
jgi:hypothetical protein